MEDYPIEWYTDQCELDSQRELLWSAHEIIITTLPQYRLDLKWKVPCYSYIKMLCYLNCKGKHIYVSFFQGSLLSDRPNLDKTGTSMVAKYHIKSPKDLLENDFIDILLEAVAIQEESNSLK